MKKLALIIAFIIALGNVTFAQKSKKGAAPEIDVPAPVLKTFNSKYKLAKKTVWTQEEDTYRADFKNGDINMATAYSSDGKLLYTEKELIKAQHNKTAAKYIQENYAGYKTTSMRKRDTYDKKTTYIALLKKSKEVLEVEFDKKGGFIRDADKTPVSASKKKAKKEEEEEEATEDEEKPAKNTKAKKGDSEDEDEEAPAPKKEKAKKSSEDEEDEEAPAPKKETKKAPAKKSNDDEEDEEEEAPAKKEKAKPAPKKKTTDDEDDE